VKVNYQVVIEADNPECCLGGFKRLVIPLFLNPNLPLKNPSQLQIPFQERQEIKFNINENFNVPPTQIPGNGLQPINPIYYPNSSPPNYQIPVGTPVNENSNNLNYPNNNNIISRENNFNNVPKKP
jgi:hypothetical protein